jgi:hypothetical protein
VVSLLAYRPAVTMRIAIVGGGPWGTYALERLAAELAATPPVEPVTITVFERTGLFGAGATHSDRQAPTSYLNRVSSQLSFASDESSTATSVLLPPELRPTFAEWVAARYRATGDERFSLTARDVPHRYLHGIALREAFERYAGMLRRTPGVTLELVADDVVDIQPGSPMMLHRAQARQPVEADRVLLVTGHSSRHPTPEDQGALFARHAAVQPPARYVRNVYPLDERLTEEEVPASRSVGVLGLGLTAIDLLLHLTEGRGGRFEEDSEGDGTLRYVPSGREPRRLVAVSPSGMFPSSRAENHKASDVSGRDHTFHEHSGVFLTIEAIDRLRFAQGREAVVSGRTVRQLDFARHVFPLVVAEMAFVYYRTLLGPRFGARVRDAVRPVWQKFLVHSPADGHEGADLLVGPADACFDGVSADPGSDELASFEHVRAAPYPGGPSPFGHPRRLADHRFDWRRLFDPLDHTDASTPERWTSALVDHMRTDLLAAAQGNVVNPVKAACDGVWRDLRTVFSHAFDRGGLTAQSHAQLGPHHLRYYTRMSNGTGVDPMHKVLALVRTGVVDVSVGPDPVVAPVPGAPAFLIRGGRTGARREVDTLVEGRAHPFHAAHDLHPLYPALLRRGLVRLWRNPGDTGPDFVPGAIDVTESFHPVDAQGRERPEITVLGSPVEGVVHFQLAAARPHTDSSILRNIAVWAGETLSDLTSPRRRQPA